MRKISITIDKTQQLHINSSNHGTHHSKDGISIDFFFDSDHYPQKEQLHIISNITTQLEWFEYENNEFYFDLNKIKDTFSVLFANCIWMKGTMKLSPDFENHIATNFSIVSFSATEEEIETNFPKKIFLSHKSSNKDMVRQYFYLLKELGFEPWLDEDAMVAGSNLNRSILQGFKDSCAAVFFITPQFIDEDYLSDEIDYAMQEKMDKKGKFSIITLQFSELSTGKKGIIPDLLKRYVWKQPVTDLEAFREIIKSLPIKLGKSNW